MGFKQDDVPKTVISKDPCVQSSSQAELSVMLEMAYICAVRWPQSWSEILFYLFAPSNTCHWHYICCCLHLGPLQSESDIFNSLEAVFKSLRLILRTIKPIKVKYCKYLI